MTSTLAVGKVARIARRWLLELSCCLATHCGFLQKASALLVYLLVHALSARCFPSFRPDTASIRSCLLLPPGFLVTREAGICAGSRAWSSSFFLIWFCTCWHVPGGFKQSMRNVSSSVAEIGRFCNYMK